jgi:hypothetical protein
MSYICTGKDGSTLPVICHCQLVLGFGRQIRRTEDVDEGAGLVDAGRGGDDVRIGDEVRLVFVGDGGWLVLPD